MRRSLAPGCRGAVLPGVSVIGCRPGAGIGASISDRDMSQMSVTKDFMPPAEVFWEH